VTSALFEVVALIAGRHARSERRAATAWTAPIVLTAVVAGVLSLAGDPGAVEATVASASVVGTLALVASWGSLPWRSRWLVRIAGRARPKYQPALLWAVAIAATVCGVASAVAAGEVSTRLLVASAVLVEVVVAMVLVGVRQWRLAPSARVRDVTVLLVVALTNALVVLPLGTWSPWAGAGAIAATAAVVVARGRRPAVLASASTTPAPQRADSARPSARRRERLR
jgi:hypothetical protein